MPTPVSTSAAASDIASSPRWYIEVNPRSPITRALVIEELLVDGPDWRDQDDLSQEKGTGSARGALAPPA
ncbi:hypothetical protein GCM10009718_30780 [Isoptericola halotolerans]